MNSYRKSLGVQGENFVCGYLKERGYKIIARNVRCGRGEIDVIARDGAALVFVEVKSRNTEGLVPFIEQISAEQQEKIAESCEAYMDKNQIFDENYRIDLVGLVIQRKHVKRIVHIKGII